MKIHIVFSWMKNECPKNENTYDSFMNKEWSKINLCKTWRKCKCPNRKNNKIKLNNEKNYMHKDYFEN
jgi:hypothetical protein